MVFLMMVGSRLDKTVSRSEWSLFLMDWVRMMERDIPDLASVSCCFLVVVGSWGCLTARRLSFSARDSCSGSSSSESSVIEVVAPWLMMAWPSV